MLKADFHMHTGEDPIDYWIKHSAKDLIDRAARLNYDVLAITNHQSRHYNKELADYAMERGILLIPGIEALINGKHVVILNAGKEVEDLRTFSDLREFKKKNPDIFVLAAHPFYPKKISLHNHFFRNVDVFDGVEFCHYYLKNYKPYNMKAIRKARKYGKPLIGTSDTHQFTQFNKTYSMVDARKNIKSVLDALKDGKVKIKTRPLSYTECTRIMIPMIWHKIRRFLLGQGRY